MPVVPKVLFASRLVIQALFGVLFGVLFEPISACLASEYLKLLVYYRLAKITLHKFGRCVSLSQKIELYFGICLALFSARQ